MDGYKRLSLLWPALCEAVRCLRVDLREGKVIPLRFHGGSVEAAEGVAETGRKQVALPTAEHGNRGRLVVNC